MWTKEHREKYKDDGRRYPSDLTDVEWKTIEPLFSGYEPLTANLREMVNACLYLEKTGCQWRAIAKDFGPWQTVRTWHDRFRDDGIWADAAALLTRAVRHKHGSAGGPLDRHPGLPKRRLGTPEGTPRLRWQQEDQGHQAPRPDLLAGLRPGRPGHRGQPA